jgi:hypothetical protein
MEGQMTDDKLECKTGAAAAAVLDTLAGVLKGTQRAALLAVKNWIGENMPKDFDEETAKRIQSIYDNTFDEAAQKAIKWQVHGGEPEHGTRAEVPFLFNAETKTWELENEMPPVWTEPNPDILPQADYSGDEDTNP